MATPNDENTGARREQARTRLRHLTRFALLATTAATVAIGIVVAREHPGKSAAGTTTSGSTGGSTGTTGSSGSTGNTGSVSTGNTGNSGASSFSPSVSSQRPSVTSGGSSR
ncbi:MAG TPA: hypothetical protein VGF51_03735 [Acidimicrobiales bacterium]|jgi:hypothetical protein